jgi:hypothetical protein
VNILFLDIDGVLNSLSSCVAIGLSHPSKDPKQANLDPVAVGLLKEICKECDLSIYVHSTWCMGRDTAWFKDLFSFYGFTPTILDRVHLRDERHLRIKQAMQHYRPEKFIVLDDADLSKHFGKEYIFIDNRNGLGWEHYETILARFGKQVPVILF